MKLREICRFEIGFQLRRVSTWLFFAALMGFIWRLATEGYIGIARSAGFLFNGPFVVASLTITGSLIGLLAAAALAGNAAARDVQTGMHPLVYTAPIRRAAYLGGRFLAAFLVLALILLAVPAALLLATLSPALEAELMGPFRPEVYLSAYLFLALPNAFVATALLFSIAALTRQAMASYAAAVLMFMGTVLSTEYVAKELGLWDLAKLLDPFGMIVLSEIARTWTPAEKSTVVIALQGSVISNRLLWITIALAVLALTRTRFRFSHPVAGGLWSRLDRWRETRAGDAPAPAGGPVAVPRVRPAFGRATRARQALAVAHESFRTIALGWGGLVVAGMTVLLVLLVPELISHMGVPLHPTTGEMIAGFTSDDLLWIFIPLLTVFYAGELVWRERDAGTNEIADAMPVPEWVPFLGKFLGLALALVALQAVMTGVGILVQARLGHHDFELGLYARVMFGIQLADYLLLALLAMVVHVVVDRKYVGHMVALAAWGFMTFGAMLGIEHNLLVYGSDPGWAWSDLRGFGPTLGPWLWFELYWTAWALLLAVAARLLWVRGRERGFGSRLRLARGRLTRPVVGAAAAAGALVLLVGAFVYYNTNVLNAYQTEADGAERRAEYERLYGRYDGAAQPRLAATRLRVEIHPDRREVEIQGSHHLVNRSGAAIDSIHVATETEVETRALAFDRPSTVVLAEDRLGHRIHVLETPLAPGDSLRLDFEVRFRPRGFTNRGIDPAVAANGTYFEPDDWIPAIGYQPGRELMDPGERRVRGLPARPAVRSLDDASPRLDHRDAERLTLNVVIGTAADQTAIAPGRLRRTWSEGGRRWFEYATDTPIRNDYAIFSAAYAVHRARWRHVDIEIVHHSDHAWNVERMARATRAALEYHTGRFGPYPHGQIRLVEYPSSGNSLHAYPVNVSYQEGFSLFAPDRDPRDIDFAFGVVAHEVAHQWWGNQLVPANVEGAPLLTESLAWYTAMGVVEETHGPAHLRRFMGVLRQAYQAPRGRAGVPLLRADDWLMANREGPFALYTLREYVGGERVDRALRRLLEKHGGGEPPLPTSLDLYRELQAVTPDSLRHLLVDLFATNTFWELETTRASAEPAGDGAWRVTLDVWARKVAVDSLGIETEVAMDDRVEIGVFAAPPDGGQGRPLYRRMHRIRTGEQRITVTVPGEPDRAGVDPRDLLMDGDFEDNVMEVTAVAQSSSGVPPEGGGPGSSPGVRVPSADNAPLKDSNVWKRVPATGS